MVYHTNRFDVHASPAENFRILDNERLTLLKRRVKEFGVAVSADGAFKNPKVLSQLLVSHNLTRELFFDTYTTGYVVE